MADLTVGEVAKVLQLNLVNIDQTQTPNVQNPLDLTNATAVSLIYVITDSQGKPKSPVITKPMSIVNAAQGIVQYSFAANDLAATPEMSKYGVFRYSVKVTYSNGQILFAIQDGTLTIKNDAVL